MLVRFNDNFILQTWKFPCAVHNNQHLSCKFWYRVWFFSSNYSLDISRTMSKLYDKNSRNLSVGWISLVNLMRIMCNIGSIAVMSFVLLIHAKLNCVLVEVSLKRFVWLIIISYSWCCIRHLLNNSWSWFCWIILTNW